uniref:NTR domain-containing protein n=1 Tax=Margaritifera margaritifera TaxID=102329 RepID=NCP_PINMG|nr:RecName: Full=NTR domain-containing protein; AltName: Full=Prism tissue inhibitor metalloproteinase protein 2; Flags: Precursor [Pinctada margaritifera]CCE46173.1 prism tissue inhibitor metalloproteinase protein 2 [Pinctada margaritifera]
MVCRFSYVQVVLILVVLSVIISWANACSCFPPDETRQQKCRRADFVFLGRGYVTGIQQIGSFFYLRYCFLIDRVFKDRASSLNIPCALTNVESSYCGVRFERGRRYIVSGYLTRSGNQIGACEWNERWSNVPFLTRLQLFNDPQWCLP